MGFVQLLESQSFPCLSARPSISATVTLCPGVFPFLVPPASDPGEPLSGAGGVSALPPTAPKGVMGRNVPAYLKNPSSILFGFIQTAFPEQEKELCK